MPLRYLLGEAFFARVPVHWLPLPQNDAVGIGEFQAEGYAVDSCPLSVPCEWKLVKMCFHPERNMGPRLVSISGILNLF